MKARPSAACRTPRSPRRRNDLEPASDFELPGAHATEGSVAAETPCSRRSRSSRTTMTRASFWRAVCGQGQEVYPPWGSQPTASEPVADGKAHVERGERNLHGQRSDR